MQENMKIESNMKFNNILQAFSSHKTEQYLYCSNLFQFSLKVREMCDVFKPVGWYGCGVTYSVTTFLQLISYTSGLLSQVTQRNEEKHL